MAEVTTYTTSLKCAKAAGMKTLGDNTVPDTTTVDDLRTDVKSAIGEVIGHDTADSNGVAARIERTKVRLAIIAIRKAAADPKMAPDYDLTLTDADKQSLIDEFNIEIDDADIPICSFIPGENL